MNNAESPGPVVVGIDGSNAAIGAAEWAAQEAVHQDVPVRLVHIIPAANESTGSGTTYPVDEEYAESSLRAACSVVEATGLPVKIDTAVLRGDIEPALIRESKHATLICVGSVGIGRVAAAVVGSTAATLAEQAHCPVAVIRRNHDAPLPDAGFIAVVVDDKPGNDVVMRWAMEEARVRRAPVLALGVASWPFFDSNNERVFRRLHGWLRQYPDVHVEVATTRLRLTRYLEGFIGATQLVVIGSDDADRVAELVGPHSLPILAHADCSVLIARSLDQSTGSQDHRRSLIAGKRAR